MAEMKRCPYCGQEILAVAKKCRYCGEWLDDAHRVSAGNKKLIPCPICGEQVEEGTVVCPHCHEKIGDSYAENRVVHSESKRPQMSSPKANCKEENAQFVKSPKSESNDYILPSFFDYYFVEPLFRHYTDFRGKISRKQYWMTVLYTIIVCLLFSALDLLFGTLYIFSALFSLALFIPGIAIGIRRLHDVDKSGWWLLISLIPFIGAIILIVFFCKEGESQCKKAKFKLIDTIISTVTALLVILGFIVFFHRNSNESSTSEFNSTETIAAPDNSTESDESTEAPSTDFNSDSEPTEDTDSSSEDVESNTGNIGGKYDIEAEFTISPGAEIMTYEGRYRYSGQSEWLKLEGGGPTDGNELYFDEYNAAGEKTGKFEGTLKNDGSIGGYYTNYRNQRFTFVIYH